VVVEQLGDGVVDLPERRLAPRDRGGTQQHDPAHAAGGGVFQEWPDLRRGVRTPGGRNEVDGANSLQCRCESAVVGPVEGHRITVPAGRTSRGRARSVAHTAQTGDDVGAGGPGRAGDKDRAVTHR
jgi:hypothetical protein